MTLNPGPLAVAALVLSVAGVAGVAAALVSLVLTVRRLRRAVELAEARLAALRRDVEAATAIGVRAGERLRKLEQGAGQIVDRLGQLELRGEGRPYDQAIDLVRHGADAERLVRNFGLTRGEADLLALVHGRRRKTG